MSVRDHKARARITETRAIFRKADEAYAPYSCPASGECCQLSKTKRQPWVMRSEWDVLTDQLEREGLTLPNDREDGGCPFLDPEGKRCTVYAARPFGCRTFFCERIRGPNRQPVAVVDSLLRRLTALNEAEDEGDDAALEASRPPGSLGARHAEPDAPRAPACVDVDELGDPAADRGAENSGRLLLDWIRLAR